MMCRRRVAPVITPQGEHVLALDGLVVLVNRDNPIAALRPCISVINVR